MGRGYVNYRPVRTVPVADEAEVQAMLRRIKKRAEVIVQGGGELARGEAPSRQPEPDGAKPCSTPASLPSEVAQSPQAKSELEWVRAGNHDQYSTNRRYHVHRFEIGGTRKYQLSFKKAGMEWWRPMEPFDHDSFESAKQAAQQHWQSC